MAENVHILEAVCEIAKEEGCEYTFSLPGGGQMVLDAQSKISGIPTVMFRHEQSLGFALDAWGRLSRRPGFAICGPGTGLTNLTTGLVQAYAAGVPGVAVVGESGTEDDDLYGGQGCARSENQYRGITKWARRVPNPNTLLFQVKRAFRSAVTPPAGPCVVAYTSTTHAGTRLPREQAYTNFSGPGWKPREWKILADPADIQELVKWLLEAEKPTMIVGHEAHQDDCQDELREFVHLLGIPTNARRVARGMISELDPLNYQKARGKAISQSDRCLVFGIRVGSYLEGFGAPPYYPKNVRYAQVMNAQESVCLALNTDIEIIGHLKMVLKQMIEAAKDMGIKEPPAKWDQWRQFVAETVADGQKKLSARTEGMVGKKPLHPDLVGRYTAEVLAEKYNNDYIAIIDGFTASAYFTNWNVAVNTGTVLDAAETIGIGHGPGMSVAAGLYTKRQKPIIALLGDGAVGAGGMDIDTAVRWNIPAVYIHENNNTLITAFYDYFYANIAAPTGNKLWDSFEVTHDVRYDRVFGEMGCYTEFADSSEQVKPAIERAIAASLKEQKPSFVEIMVDQMVISSLFAGPLTAMMFSAQVPWDKLPERGRQLAARGTPEQMIAAGMLPQDWADGIRAMQKK